MRISDWSLDVCSSDLWVKRVVTTMWHPVGTCRMGQDARAVVDARLRVRGVDDLRVIDAAIMPNITSGNTNAPTQALARHATAMLVEDLKRTWGAPARAGDAAVPAAPRLAAALHL